MNYKPVITFREIKPTERELMKNAESILKELGFKFKATSPFRDDREWELLFSDDYSKEMYIQFKDDADELHSPTVIIDDIINDKLATEDGNVGYFYEQEIGELDLVISPEKQEEISNMFTELSEDYLNEIKYALKNDNEVLLNDIFQKNKNPLEFLISDLKKISKEEDDEEKLSCIVETLAMYINSDEVMEAIDEIMMSDE